MMRGLSTELLYVLAFAAIGLLRYLWQRLRRVQPWEEKLARQQRAEAQAASDSGASLPGSAAPGSAPSGASLPAPSAEPVRRAPALPHEGRSYEGRSYEGRSRERRSHEGRSHEGRSREPGWRSGPGASAVRERSAVTASTSAPRRRFSRVALFGDRRRTQDAVVAATILGPCRAAAPYDADR